MKNACAVLTISSEMYSEMGTKFWNKITAAQKVMNPLIAGVLPYPGVAPGSLTSK